MEIMLPLLLLSVTLTYSDATVCLCKDASEQELQKVIDFACGGGADCTQIQTTGACYQPNTVKNHCDVAVNSYYQKKASTGATCDFNGAAVIATSSTSSCLSSSSSNVTPTNGTPSTGNSTTTGTSTNGTPSTGNSTTGTPTTTYPSTGSSTTGTPTYGTPTSFNSSSSAFPGTTLGPSSSISGDPSSGEELSIRTTTIILLTTMAAVALRV